MSKLYKDDLGNYYCVIASYHYPERNEIVSLVVDKHGLTKLVSEEKLQKDYIQEVINKAARIP